MRARPWLPLAACALACLLAAEPLYLSLRSSALSLMALSGFLFLGAGATALLGRKRRDPYDLNVLREIHEREESNPDVPGVFDGGAAVCPHCGKSYSAVYPSCPHCRC